VPDRTFIDSSVLVYLFAGDAPKKRDVVADLLREAAADGSLVISTQVMHEVYSVITGRFKRPLSREAAGKALDRMHAMEVVVPDAGMVLAASARCRKEGDNLADELIVEAALRAGCSRLFSEDLLPRDEYGVMRVLNPFPGYV
jgi:predicted nucleic acid-binding protein